MTKVGFVSLGCPKNLVDSEVMMGILARRGLLRVESQTPYEFAAAVNSPNLASPVQEFTQIYAHARFGGAPCDTTRLRQLLNQIRVTLRGR